MLNLLICNKEQRYALFDLHAEQVFGSIDYNYQNCSESSKNSSYGKGFYSYTLTQTTIENIEKNLNNVLSSKAICKEDYSFIIFDFSNIKHIQPNIEFLFEKIFYCLYNKQLSMLFTNVEVENAAFIRKINSNLQEKYKDYFKSIEEYDQYFTYAFLLKEHETVVQIKRDWKSEKYKIFYDIFIFKLNKLSKENLKPLQSTAVYSNKYINVKGLIEDDTKFFNYCIYILATKMNDLGLIYSDYDKNSQLTLFCHSLNGTYIAGILSRLLCMNISFLDHLGPISNLYKTNYTKVIKQNQKYLIISDVVCMGSEVKRVETILQLNGGISKGVICIVNCQTAPIDSKSRTCALLCIDKTYNPINYNIYTNFCHSCRKEEFVK